MKFRCLPGVGNWKKHLKGKPRSSVEEAEFVDVPRDGQPEGGAEWGGFWPWTQGLAPEWGDGL